MAFEERIAPITRDPLLRWYATILSLVHALVGIAWVTDRHIDLLVTSPRAACWPLLLECQSWREHFTQRAALAAVCVYVGLGVIGAVLFLVRARRAALATFVLTSLVGACLYALDYRLRFNQVYMLSWVVVVFLVARNKVYALQALVASFYFWAGTLKLNAEWTSGAALYKKPWLVPQSLVPASCVYVLALELVLVWGLFSPRPRVRWAVYAQLLLFHFVSFGVVGYFYPILMVGLSAIFPLAWISNQQLTLATLRTSVWDTVFAVVGIFSVFQLVPHAFPGDTAMTGEGRLFALHMFDARIECSGGAYAVDEQGRRKPLGLIDRRADTRSRCDPLVLYGTARWWCGELARKGDPRRLDIDVRARRTTDTVEQPLFVVQDFCNAGLTYSPFHHNAWLGAP